MANGILIKMKKTAVVYDKWLSTLGGGEIVSCGIAKVLLDNGYKVTFVSGEKVSLQKIKERLDIDLKGATFTILWNDQKKLNQLTVDKDIFINISYADFLIGKAKNNFYYAFFPNKPRFGWEGKVSSPVVFLMKMLYKPIEFLTKPMKDNSQESVYELGRETILAPFLLKEQTTYTLSFSIKLNDFSKSNLSALDFSLDQATVLRKKVFVHHSQNTLAFYIKFKAQNETCYIKIANLSKTKMRLYKPILTRYGFLRYLPENRLSRKFLARARAGFFPKTIDKINQYQKILTCAKYPATWIKNYWHRESVVVYPPIEMLFEKYDLSKYKKEKKILSVGRFFTSGHGKKQEIMIKAFKKFYDYNNQDWELHLAGGLNDEPASKEFAKQLQKEACGYPIFFHFNCSRKKIEKLYLKSRIYWHAAGFGENKSKNPIRFEHFGIAPIEAISAGCIPLLYNGGGLPETLRVAGLSNEHLFNSIEELVKNTGNLLRRGARIDVKTLSKLKNTFSVESFKATIKKELSI